MATFRNNDLIDKYNSQGVGTGLLEISRLMLLKVNSAGMCVTKHSFTCCQDDVLSCQAFPDSYRDCKLYRGVQLC